MRDTSTDISFATDDDVHLEGSWHPAANALGVVVATHPHPQFGGDMHNTAPATFARTLPPAGFSVLRFNFRGVGRSSGVHDDGNAEHLDVVAAIEEANRLAPELPLSLIGYSFGADIVLDVVDERVQSFVAIAPPLRMFADFATATDGRRKHLVSPAHDQFCPPAEATERTAGWVNTSHAVLEQTDHFLLGATNAMVAETLSVLTPTPN